MTRRLATLMGVVTALVVIAFVVPLALVIRSVEQDDEVDTLVTSGTALAAFVDNQTTRAEIEDAVRRFGLENPKILLTVYERGGDSIGAPVPANELVADAFGGAQTDTTENGDLVVYIPNNGPFDIAAQSDYVIRVSSSGDVARLGVRRLIIVLGISTVIAAVVSAVVGWISARAISRPTRELTAVARRMQGGDLSRRATPEGPPELRELAVALNHLAGRIDELLVRERESVADLAHRLRTPLTALHLEIEALPDSPEVARLDERARRLEATLSEIIGAMRGEPGGAAAVVDLRAVAAERLSDWADVAIDGGRELSVTIEPVAPRLVSATADDLEAAFDAILNNALMHTPAEASVEVAVTEERGEVRFTVDDDGPGFPDGTVAVRGRSSHGSTGLGLDIARRTVEEAGGTIELGTSPLGGARVILAFPIRGDAGR